MSEGYDPDVAKAAAEAMQDQPQMPRRPTLPLYEEIAGEVSQHKPEISEGFFLRTIKPVDSRFLACHHFVFSKEKVQNPMTGEIKTQSHSNFNLGAIVIPAGASQTMVRCDLDDNFNVVARGSYEFLPWLVGRLTTQLIKPMGGQDQSGMEVNLQAAKDKWNAKLSITTNSVFQANALHQMTQNIALGAELLYVGKNNVSGVSLLGRYSGRDHTVSAQWSSMGALSMSWIRKYTDKVSVGASRMELDGQGLLSELLKISLWSSLEITRMMGRQEAICQAGYDATFRSARLRGSIDTAGVVRAQLEEKIVPGATLSVSAEIDHARQEHRFGLGLSTDPMGP